ncbi:oxidoreductase OrdL [Rodentibacter pneumotropicus]|uniref:Oxidoreductase OrdL n=1 Tax=Rodentibacter pneumotropicus TaxID=758 RepID=A0A3S4U388_9PAST|nr:oxidoreductase OrdL [Rodentibacter pneumotropicus]
MRLEKGYATLALNYRRMDDLIEMEKASHKNLAIKYAALGQSETKTAFR